MKSTCMQRSPGGAYVINAPGAAMPYPVFYCPNTVLFHTAIHAPGITFKHFLDFLSISFIVLQRMGMFASAYQLIWKWPAACANIIVAFIAVPNAI